MTEAQEELGRLALALLEEKRFEEEQFRRRNSEIPIKQKKQEGVCWSPVQLKNRSYGLGGRPELSVERNPADTHDHQFQSGSPVFVSTDEEGERGIVISCDERSMKIGLYCEDLPDWIEEVKHIQLAYDSRSYKEMEFALNQLINADRGELANLRERLIGSKEPRFSTEHLFQSTGLNDSQNEAVQNVMNAEEIAIIHGPPGTGKTTTLVAAVVAVVPEEGQVLVCAPSNAATDHLLKKLSLAGVKAVRIGELSRMDEDILEFSLDQLVDRDPAYDEVRKLKRKALESRKKAEKYKRQFGSAEREERRQLYAEARETNKQASKLEDYITQKKLDEAQAIVCTLIGSSSRELRGRKYKTVFIDEAGQAMEPATWVPILKAQRVVLAGDPFQLPPTVKNPEAEKQGLAVSLMEKVMSRKNADVMLRTQYRMNRLIMEFSNREFYRGELMAHESVADSVLLPGDVAVEFIDTAGCGFEEERSENSSSLSNSGEAGTLRKILDQLMESYPEDCSYGIISPYKDQVRLLKEELNELKLISINTVDGFQGQERDVILVSLVRSNEEGIIGFLNDFRRMNVALTRAKKKLVVIGDSGTIGAEPFYQRFLEYIEAEGQYRSAWEWMDI